MPKPITPKVKEIVMKGTEVALEENKEVDTFKIIEILEKDHNIKFFNIEILQKLI